MTISRHLTAFSVVGLLALAAAGCSGEADNTDETEINDAKTASALSSPDPNPTDDQADRADHDDDDDHGDDKSDCKDDGDHAKHHHHRHHRFEVLDKLDGTHDREIAIASLPSALPPRLIARLHEIDTNGDGVVRRTRRRPGRRRTSTIGAQSATEVAYSAAASAVSTLSPSDSSMPGAISSPFSSSSRSGRSLMMPSTFSTRITW